MRRRALYGGGEFVNGYEFIDLGLSVKWATCNIGASEPEECGWLFQWAGTTAYNPDRTPVGGGPAINFTYDSNCPYWVSGSSSNSKWSKYTQNNSYSSTGVADGKLILEPVDDAAHVHIREDCRVPTIDELNELRNACNLLWTYDYNGSGVSGAIFTLKYDSSKSLFFPCNSGRTDIIYWLANLYNTSNYYSYGILGYPGQVAPYNFDRSIGNHIRAVK